MTPQNCNSVYLLYVSCRIISLSSVAVLRLPTWHTHVYLLDRSVVLPLVWVYFTGPHVRVPYSLRISSLVIQPDLFFYFTKAQLDVTMHSVNTLCNSDMILWH